ncbi:DsbA family oxidoreductase [Stenotrophomonas maltophilia]|jgi:predicted DsbA family dithiol-disulfide isomerase|uniref:Polyketide synthase n=1 Tax=Stenotrophomonas maltophilia TaxID=40324 RepID=A0AAP7GST7_STEMA|nr:MULTISPECIES: DsbA family oxidoreductase [Stenotrophomonas]KOQ65296.1 polyketide synthase [Stenotrophomonas maltophilia]MBA0223813.1 DsbA family oxidoreductase [Stenotrophomonas maltophilia]MBH1592750.1 DsbA family oxidoreductase [Stenotrophomonas maltophilia]MBH1837456.1 DsbA family oxidoreductase [Stenotrophomonas maltophilia]MBN4939345.1 DsbA family oxidoreductase [Stenotrophomonas maltophilia]
MRIDIYSDVVCPWCWIGKHRFQQGVQLLGADAPVLDIHWQPFQLDPDAGTTPVPLREAYARKFGGVERTEQILGQTQATARGEGLPMDFSQGQVRVTTLPAHRLLWLAGQHGVQDAVGEALFRAHFEHGQNLADTEVLTRAGVAGGLDAAEIAQMLASSRGLAEVEAGLDQARALGVSSVPTFVIDGRWAISGAQPPEAFAQALRQIAAEQGTATGRSGDDACGADGCRV